MSFEVMNCHFTCLIGFAYLYCLLSFSWEILAEFMLTTSTKVPDVYKSICFVLAAHHLDLFGHV